MLLSEKKLTLEDVSRVRCREAIEAVISSSRHTVAGGENAGAEAGSGVNIVEAAAIRAGGLLVNMTASTAGEAKFPHGCRLSSC